MPHVTAGMTIVTIFGGNMDLMKQTAMCLRGLRRVFITVRQKPGHLAQSGLLSGFCGYCQMTAINIVSYTLNGNHVYPPSFMSHGIFNQFLRAYGGSNCRHGFQVSLFIRIVKFHFSGVTHLQQVDSPVSWSDNFSGTMAGSL